MLASVLKYKRFLTIGYQTRMEHRFSVFVSIAVFMFPLVAKIAFWKAVYGTEGGAISGFNMSDMITYLLVLQFVFEFTWCYPGNQVRRAITGGGLTPHLIRPANYLMTMLFRSLGNMFPRWTSTLGIFAFFLLVFRQDVNLPQSFWIYPATTLAIVLCYFLLFLYSFLIGLAAFWLEGDIPLLGQVHTFFSGWVVPLTFFPEWLARVADYLPFKYTLYFPTVLMMGKVTTRAALFGLAMQVLWIVVFLTGIHFVWKRGIRRYGAYGG